MTDKKKTLEITKYMVSLYQGNFLNEKARQENISKAHHLFAAIKGVSTKKGDD